MKKILFIACLTLITGVLDLSSQTKATPQQIFNETIKKLIDTKGVEAHFTINNSGYSGKGSVKTFGSEFSVVMPDAEIWYNGKDLYTYNKNTQETTVVKPTDEELSQSNPLAYVYGAKSNYTISFSTVKKVGSYVLELIPKTKSADIKRITLTVRNNDYIPEKIVVEPHRGNPIVAEITSFKTGISFTSKDFDYPKAKYPKAEIIDLR